MRSTVRTTDHTSTCAAGNRPVFARLTADTRGLWLLLCMTLMGAWGQQAQAQCVPTYASFPYSESFETWVNCGSTTDAPSVNWRGTPATGNASWRRNDQQSSAGWTSAATGAYSPVFTVGANSARFHSSIANTTASIGQLDLFINCSTGPLAKRVSFDYINTSGTDNLKVLLSLDGGLTFNQIGNTLTTVPTWINQGFSFSSASATTVIRLEAQGGTLSTDIGVDNFAVTATCTPTYASFPFTESFESWSNCNSTTDIPGAAWQNNPAFGNASWRRNDQQASGSWVNPTLGAYSPAFTAGSNSARFHSYQANSGSVGNLDLYINCSTGPANKLLNFDLINTSGSDSLRVLVSLNGGATFTRIGAFANSSAGWVARPLVFTSLSPNTVIRFSALADGGATDIGIDNVRVTAPCTPVYASFPYTQSFESWTTCVSTTDVPSNNWVNNNPMGNNAWRRNDQGSSASWTTASSGAFSPTFSAGAFSARFHSYQAINGTNGSMDLFIDCSAGGAQKRVAFDHINTSGTDVLTVLMSTDAGVTFTSLGSVSTNATWTNVGFNFTSSSATTVLRFQATSDNGLTDIGMDNLSVIDFVAAPGCLAGPTSPTDAQTGTAVNAVALTWPAAPTATGYDVYFGTSVGGMTLVSGNQSGTSYTTGTLFAGVTYFWRVVPRNAGGPATNCPAWSFTTQPIANDVCAGALPLTCGGSVSGNTTSANDDVIVACSTSTGSNFRGLWYAITPPAGLGVTLSTCGASWDTYIRVYEGSCGALVCKAANDDGCGSGNASQVFFTATGATYYVLVSGYNASAFGAFTLTASCVAPPSCVSAPTAPAVGATNITYGFPVNLSWSSVASATGYDVYLGTSASAMTLVSSNQAGTSYNTAALSPATTYFWRIEPRGAGGPAVGCTNWTFTTSPVLNDACSGAIPLTCGGSVSGNTNFATNDAINTCGITGVGNNFKGLWHSIVAQPGQTVTLSLCNGTNFDSYLRVYEGTCGSLVCVAGNDDFCGNRSEVTFSSTNGGTYYALITGFSSTSSGTYTLAATCSNPTYNPCASITPIPSAGTNMVATFPSGSGAGWNNSGCGFTTDGHEFVYSFTPTISGTHYLEVTSGTGGYVDYSFKAASAGCNANSLNCIGDVASSDMIAFGPLTAGTTYYILLDAEGTAARTQNFHLLAPNPCPEATLTAGCNPVSVTASTANALDDCSLYTGYDRTYAIVLPYAGTWDINTCGAATNFDTRLYLSNACCSGQISANDDNCGFSSRILYTGGPGTVYVDVEGYLGDTGTFVLTVLDVTPPTAVCANQTVTLDATGNAAVTAEDFDAGSFATCGINSFVVSQTDFTCADVPNRVVVVTVTGGNGLVDTCQARVTVQDQTPPTAVCANLNVTLDANGQAAIAAEDLDGGSSDNCGIATIVASQTTFTCAEVPTKTITLTVTDASGNASVCTSTITVQDLTPPTAVCNNLTAVLDATGFVQVEPLDLVTASTDNCAIDTATGNCTFFCENVGANPRVITVIDVNGNTATCTATVTIIDNTAPIAACNDISVTLDGNGQASIAAEDLDGGASDNCSIASITASQTDFTCADAPTAAVTVTFIDPSGNSSTCVSNITVIDELEPVITCPANISANTTPGACSAVVNYNLTATDNCSAQVTVSPASGSTFNVGTTPVNATATDPSGNLATCSFTVTVIDNQAPVITCPAAITVCAVPGTSTAPVTFASATATDNCPGVTVAQIAGPASGSNFNVGNTTVTFRATDATGLTANCSFTVTVNQFSIFGAVFTESLGTISTTSTIAAHEAANGFDNDGYTMGGSGSITNTQSSATFYPLATGGANASLSSVGQTFEISGINTLGYTAMTMGFGLYKSSTTSNGTELVVSVSTNGTTYSPLAFTPRPTGTGTNRWYYTNAFGSIPATANLRIRFTSTSATTQFRVDDILLIGNTTTANISASRPLSFCNGDSTRLAVGPASSYLWSNGATTQSILVTTPGTYSVTVTGSNGCQAIAPAVNVTVFPNPTVTATSVNATCPGVSNGSATAVGAGGNGPYTYLWTPGGQTTATATNLGAGTYSVVAISANGCSSTPATVTISDTDTVPPVAVCANSNIVLDASGNAVIAAEDLDGGSSDNCGIASITASQTAFTCANIPGVTVTLTVTDGSGNTSTCIASVTVQDVTPPTAVCNSAIAYLDETGYVQVEPLDLVTASTDACGIDTATGNCTFLCENLGDNPRVITVIDVNGNTATCTATVTVLDTIAPTAVCADISVTLDGSGQASIIAEDLDGGSGDNCGIVSITASQTDFTCADAPSAAVTMTFTDASGNSSTCIANVAVIDDLEPVITCPANISVGTDATACNTVVTYNVNATDNCSAQVTVSPASGSTFNVGTTTVNATATDPSGNSATCSFTVTVSDDDAPVAVCNNITVSLDASGNAVIAAEDIDGGSSDNCGIASITASQTAFTCANTQSGVTVTLTVTDGSGNTSTCTASVTVQDVTPPTAVCNDAIAYLDETGYVQVEPLTLVTASTDACGIDTATGNCTFLCENLGDNPRVITVIDVNGNTDTCTATVTVLDTIAPTAVCADISVTLDGSGQASIIAEDLDGGSGDNCGIVSINASQTDFTCADAPSAAVTMTFTDASGNSSTCIANVTVIDDLEPVITCPANISVGTSVGICGAVVNYNVTATDNCSAQVTVNPASGSTFNIGTTTVNATATDPSGNSAACSFTVTVTDNQAPSIACPANISVNTAAGTCAATVTYIAPVGTDNCPGATTVQTAGLPSGSSFPIGVTTNTFTVTAANGQTAACSFTVTVIDNQAPVITCPAAITVCAVLGTGSAPVTFASATATDNCPGVTVAQIAGPASGSNFNVGNTTVTFRATDATGLTANCSFTVTVNQFSIFGAVFTESLGTISTTSTIAAHEAANGFDNDGYTMGGSGSITNTQSSATFYPLATGGANASLSSVGQTFEISGINTLGYTAMTMGFGLYKSSTTSNGTELVVSVSTNGTTYSPLAFTPRPTGTGTNRWYYTNAFGSIPATANLRIRFTSTSATTQFRVDDILLIGNTTTANISASRPLSFCNGDSTRLAVGPASSYLWSNGATTQSILVTTPGTYSVTVTGSNGCQAIAPAVNVTVFPNPTVTATSVNATCPGVSNGSATAVGAGGNGPYTYLWTPGGQTTATATNLGAGTYSVVAISANGCSSTPATVTITDADTVPPVAVCANSNIVLDASGNAVIAAEDLDGGSSDNCGIASIVASQTAFTCANIPGVTVTLTVTDGSGNTSTCTASVTVQDMTPPTAVCNSAIAYLDETGYVQVEPLDLVTASTDACGIDTATGNCTFLCENLGDNPRVITVIDVNGNTDTCTATVTVLDTIAPTAVCADISVTLDGSGQASIIAEDLDGGSGDNCGIVSITASQTDFTCADAPSAAVTMTFIDASGNSGTCIANVTVIDDLEPVITCPANISVGTDATACNAVVTYNVNATDNCSAQVTVSPASGSTFNVGTTTVNATATDPSGNSATCSFTVTVTDDDAPVAVCNNITVSLDASGNAVIAAEDIDAGSSDNCGIASIVASQTSFTCANTQSGVVVTLTVTDVNGNTSTCTANVTVIDNLPPTAVCNDATVYLDAAGVVQVEPLDLVTASTDNCAIDTATGNCTFFCSDIGPNPRVITVIDVNGNTDTCTSTVTVLDTIAPVAVCVDQNLILDANGQVSIVAEDLDGGSSDNCAIASISASQTDFDCSNVGVNSVTLTVTDQSGNVSTCIANVSITDDIAPIITCPANISVGTDATFCGAIVNYNVNATDNCSAQVTVSPASGSTFNLGTTTVNATATDPSGNSATCSFTVTVTDDDAPVAVCNNITVSLDANGNAVIAAEDIDGGSSDNCGIASIVASQTSFTCANTQSGVVVTLTVTDVNGNTSTCTANVTVIDNLPPTAVCNDATVYLDAAGVVQVEPLDLVTASTDNCAIDTATGNCTFFCSDIGANPRVITVIDVNGNTDTCTSTVTVLDTIAPVAVCVDQNLTLDANGQVSIVAEDLDGGSSDNCAIASISASLTDFDCSNVGVNSVTLTVTDQSGNVSTCVANVSITDDIAPVITCPANISVGTDATFCGAIVNYNVNATDNCSAQVTVSPASGSTFNVGTTTVNATATDPSGNSATCSFTVTVTDDDAPAAICQDIVVQLDANGQASITAAQINNGSTDNCAIASISINQSNFSCANVGGAAPTDLFISEYVEALFNTKCIEIYNGTGAPINLAAGGYSIQMYFNGSNSVGTNVPLTGTIAAGATYTVCTANSTAPFLAAANQTSSASWYNGNDAVVLAKGGVAIDIFGTIGQDPGNAGWTAPGYQTADRTLRRNPSVIAGVTTSVPGFPTLATQWTSFAVNTSSGLGSHSVTLSGTNPVVLTVTDVNGNVSTCTGNVTVQDLVAPNAICQNLTVQLDANGNASITAGQINNGSTDACGIASVTATPTTFTCADVPGDGPTDLIISEYVEALFNTKCIEIYNGTGAAIDLAAGGYVLQMYFNGSSSVGNTVALTGTVAAGATYTVCTSTSTAPFLAVANQTSTSNWYNGNDAVVLAKANGATRLDIFGRIGQDPGNAGWTAAGGYQTTDRTLRRNPNIARGITTNPASGFPTLGTEWTVFAVNNSLGTGSHVFTGSGTNTVVLTVTDVNGNSSTCTAEVTVQDVIAPIALCQNVSVSLDASGVATITAASINGGSSDACGISSLVASQTSFTCANVGPNTVTLTVTDVNGNVSTCTAIVTVIDNTNPVITCPADITVGTDAGLCGAVVNYNVNATDNCSAQVSVSPASGSTFVVGTTTVTATATDPSGNSATCSFTVTVNDDDAPAAVCQNISVTLDASGNPVITAEDLDGGSSDNCGIASIVASQTSFTCANVGPNTVTLTVTDVNGNVSTCSAIVTVIDNTNPVITCPADITVGTDTGLCGAVVNYNVNATDNCSAQVSVSPASGSTFVVGTTTVTATATDPSGNSATCSFTVTVNDDDAPAAVCQNISVTLDASGNAVIAAEDLDGGSSDNCGIASIVASQTSFTCANVGPNTVTLTVTDVNGNVSTCSAVVTVIDNTNPVVTCPANITVGTDAGLCGAVVNYNVNATDNCSAQVSVSPASGSTFVVGTTTVTATATDPSGNSATCSFTVTVNDDDAPAAVCQNISVTLDASGNAVITAASINGGSSDNCGIASIVASQTSFTCANVGPNTVTLTVTDVNGNVSTCSAIVTVIDNTNPVITCPADITVGTDAGLCGAVVNYNVNATDNCSAQVSVNPASGSVFTVGTTTVTATATDPSGNTATCSFTVTVNDDDAPSAVCQNATVSLGSNGTVTITGSTINNGSSDNCGIASIVASQTSFTCANIGPNTVTLTVTDNAGNVSTCSAVVTVVDNSAPVITCPANITVAAPAGQCSTAVNYNVTATDNCSATLSVSPASGSIFVIGTTTVTATATDPSGNTATCSFTVTVSGNGSLTFTGIPADLTLSCGSAIPAPPAIVPCGGGSINAGDFRTQTQGGWGANCNGNNPGCYRDANFAAAFPNGLTIGCTSNRTLRLTSAAAVNTFLPCGGTPAVLSTSYINPGCINNTFASQLIAASLSVGFDNANPNYSASSVSLGSLVVASGPLAGLTVNQVIAQANSLIGGCGSSYTVSQLNTALDNINNNFVDGSANNGFLVLPGGGAGGGGVSATSACGPCPVVTFSETTVAGNCDGNYTIIRTWTATSGGTVVGTATQAITVVDNVAPVITCPANITVAAAQGQSGAVVNFNATATDNCSGATVTYSIAPGSVFPVGTTTVTATATDGCGNASTCTFTVTVTGCAITFTGIPANLTLACGAAVPAAPAIVPCGGGNGGGCGSGDFRTQTQGGWGANCNGNNPGCYRDANFAAAFPNGLTIGCSTNRTLRLTTAAAVNTFLPCGGTPAALTQSYVNPNCISNTLAGQLVTATLNVGFDNANPNFSSSTVSLGSLVLASGPMAGLTVNQVIAQANSFIGGCGSSYSASQLNAALTGINESFDNGNSNTGFLVLPAGGSGVSATSACGPCPTVTMSETMVPGSNGGFTITRTWTATSNGIVVGTATQTITVVCGPSKQGDLSEQGSAQAGDELAAGLELLRIYPVPTDRDLNLNFNSLVEGRVTVQVIDMFGKVVMQSEHAVNANGNLIRLDVSNLPMATYRVKVSNGSESFIKAFVKQ